MKPSMSVRNLTPSSTGFASAAAITPGTVDGSHKLVQGQLPCPTVTDTLLTAAWMLPLSSIARLRSVTVPSAPGTQSYVQAVRPCAWCHVEPPSTETSTPLTSTLSDAVPVIVTWPPLWTVDPAAGKLIAEEGAALSDEADA